MRIRRLPLASCALVDGRPVIEADLGYRSTTWKALRYIALRAAKRSSPLVSDDNFFMIQRNLLLQFAVIGE
jgi:hypothetical protein